jgi:hypothetical protein
MHKNTRENHGNAFFYAIAIAGKMLLRTFEKLLNVDNAFPPRTWKFLVSIYLILKFWVDYRVPVHPYVIMLG